LAPARSLIDLVKMRPLKGVGVRDGERLLETVSIIYLLFVLSRGVNVFITKAVLDN
jgi:hypothetical protein